MAVYLTYRVIQRGFLVNANGFSARLASDKRGWSFAGNSDSGVLARLFWVGIEAGMAMPLGIFVARLDSPHFPLPFARLIAVGLRLGLCLESVQLFVCNGSCQGASTVTRAAPLGISIWAWNRAGALLVAADRWFAFILETSKLFLSGTHADRTTLAPA